MHYYPQFTDKEIKTQKWNDFIMLTEARRGGVRSQSRCIWCSSNRYCREWASYISGCLCLRNAEGNKMKQILFRASRGLGYLNVQGLLLPLSKHLITKLVLWRHIWRNWWMPTDCYPISHWIEYLPWLITPSLRGVILIHVSFYDCL